MTNTPCILCATLSTECDDGLRYAMTMAQQHHASLIVVHLSPIESKPQGAAAAHGNESMYASDSISIHETLGTALAAGRGIGCEHLYLEDDPVEGIVRIACERAVTHIVIAAGGVPGHHCMERGPIADKLVHAAPCAVTVVGNEDVA